MSVPPDAAGEPPAAAEPLAASDAAGWDAAADDAAGGRGAPLEQAEATIATTANGATTRRNACFVVKCFSSSRHVVPGHRETTALQATDAIRCPPLAIARRGDGGPLLGPHTQSRAFDCRADGASRV